MGCLVRAEHAAEGDAVTFEPQPPTVRSCDAECLHPTIVRAAAAHAPAATATKMEVMVAAEEELLEEALAKAGEGAPLHVELRCCSVHLLAPTRTSPILAVGVRVVPNRAMPRSREAVNEV